MTALSLAVWVVFLRCTPDQPLPPANNPPSAANVCAAASNCGTGQVCFRSVGAGICSAPCSQDSDCDRFNLGLKCHPQIGGLCAPSCTEQKDGFSGDQKCAVLGSGFACGSDGRCAPAVASTTASLRFFFGAAAPASVDVGVDSQSTAIVTGLSPGALSATVTVPSGDRTLSVLAGGQTVLAIPVTLSGGVRYTVVLGESSPSLGSTIFNDDAPQPGLTSAALEFVRTCSGIGPLGVKFDSGRGATPVFVGVGLGEARLGPLPASTGTLAAYGALGTANPGILSDQLPVVAASANFTGAQTYDAVVWCPSPNFPELVVLSRSGVLVRQQAALLRLVDATDTISQVTLSVDESLFVNGSATNPKTPFLTSRNFGLVSSGVHRLRAWRDAFRGNVFYDSSVSLESGGRHTVVAGGLAATGTLSAVTVLDASSRPNDRVSVRLVNFAVSQTGPAVLQSIVGATMTLSEQVRLVTKVSLGQYSDEQALDVGANLVGVCFGSDAFCLGSGSPTGSGSTPSPAVPAPVIRAPVLATPGDLLLLVVGGDTTQPVLGIVNKDGALVGGKTYVPLP